jgi:uncharacterized membrane protein
MKTGIKTLSWTVVSLVVLVATATVTTGSPWVALKAALAYTVVKMPVVAAHEQLFERAWAGWSRWRGLARVDRGLRQLV